MYPNGNIYPGNAGNQPPPGAPGGQPPNQYSQPNPTGYPPPQQMGVPSQGYPYAQNMATPGYKPAPGYGQPAANYSAFENDCI